MLIFLVNLDKTSFCCLEKRNSKAKNLKTHFSYYAQRKVLALCYQKFTLACQNAGYQRNVYTQSFCQTKSVKHLLKKITLESFKASCIFMQKLLTNFMENARRACKSCCPFCHGSLLDNFSDNIQTTLIC